MSFNLSRELRSAVSLETRKGLGRRIPSRAIFMLGRASGSREEVRLLEHLVRYVFFPDWRYHHSWRDNRIRFSDGAFFCGLGGQIVQGTLSIACFTLVGVAFWRIGWKIGLLESLLVFIASNVGLRLHKYLRKGSAL